jgi:IclR family pca regulon transcriptional regulator
MLTCFSAERSVLGIADMAEHLGITRSTTHRYVTTLVGLGYLEQVAARKYRLGLRVADLGMATLDSHELRKPAHPYLDELRKQTSYAVGLGIIDATDVLYIDRLRSIRDGQNEINLRLHTGSRTPIHCTAMGKLLLANLPASEQRELISQIRLTKRGPRTITSKKALRAELAQIILTGLAVDDQELAAERYAIAVPIRNNTHNVIAAVNLAAPSSITTLTELVDRFGPALTATANNISARLGYRHTNEHHH